MPSGDLQKKEYSTIAYRFSIDNSNHASYTFLSNSKVNYKWFGAQPWRSVGAIEIDYELHLGTKLGYIKYFINQQLRHSKLTLIRNECDFNRTQIFTISMSVMQKKALWLQAK